MYRFTPNEFGKSFFHLAEQFYEGEAMTPLIERVLGRSLHAQDPLVGGKRSGEIRMAYGGDFKVIGTIEKI